MRKALVISVVLLLTGGLLAAYIALSPESEWSKATRMTRAAKARVHKDMTRGDMERALSDAWHHDVCDYDKMSEHLFFYGSSRTVDETTIIYVRTVKRDSGDVVAAVGSLEDYQLPSFAGCSELLANTRS